MTSPTSLVDPRAWRARIGVSALFLVNGALVANVLPRLPAIKAGLDLSNAELGLAIAAMPIGGLLAGGFAGALIHRVGSGRLAVSVGTVYGLLLVTVGLAPTWLALAGAFLVLGAMDATMDAAENAHGIAVQRLYGRSILHSFHGWWSAGTLLGGAMGAVSAALAIPVPLHLAVAGSGLALVALASKLLLLPDAEADAQPVSEAPAERIHPRNAPRLLRLLGPIALLGLLGVMLEDAAQTWSTVYLVDVLGLGAGLAAIAFVLYTGAMTVGRLTNDRWVDRWGDARIGRWGALLAAAGLGLVALAGPTGVAWIAFVGFIGVGIGASSMFPLMVDAAGSRPDIPAAHAVAIVSWLARAGFVIAPTLMGVAADAFGLSVAFLIPLAAALLVVFLAPSLLASASPAPDRQLVEPTGY